MLQDLIDPKLIKGIEDVLVPVDMVPITELGIDLPAKSNIDHAVVSKNRIVQFCSGDYGLRRNEDILINFLEFLKDERIKVKKLVGHNHTNSRFRMDIVLDLEDYQIRDNIKDPLKVGLRIYNSYDGSQRYMFSIGIYRLVCSNGLSILEEVGNIKKTHTTSIYEDDDLIMARHEINNVLDAFGPMMEVYNHLHDYPVRNIKTRMEEVIEETGYPASLLDGALQRAEGEVKMGYPSSDWVVYNGMNYMLNHGNSSLIGRKFEKLDKAILNFLYTC